MDGWGALLRRSCIRIGVCMSASVCDGSFDCAFRGAQNVQSKFQSMIGGRVRRARRCHFGDEFATSLRPRRPWPFWLNSKPLCSSTLSEIGRGPGSHISSSGLLGRRRTVTSTAARRCLLRARPMATVMNVDAAGAPVVAPAPGVMEMHGQLSAYLKLDKLVGRFRRAGGLQEGLGGDSVEAGSCGWTRWRWGEEVHPPAARRTGAPQSGGRVKAMLHEPSVVASVGPPPADSVGRTSELEGLFHRSRPYRVNGPVVQRWGVDIDAVDPGGRGGAVCLACLGGLTVFGLQSSGQGAGGLLGHALCAAPWAEIIPLILCR